jgi:Zn-dependent peptidase ImmA (M78 family)
MRKVAFKRGFKANANRIAVAIRKQMGLAAIDPIDPVAVCHHYDIKLIKLTELGVDCFAFLGDDSHVFSAVTVPRGVKTAIVHNDSHHPNRQRSNIGHELGHCFLGHPFSPPLTEAGERIRDGSIEGEANFFAGALLLTNEGARYIMMKGLLTGAQERYGISKPMLEWRLNESGARIIQKRSGY